MEMKALYRKSKESIRKKRNISRVFQNNMWEFREGIVFKKELEEFKGHSVTTWETRKDEGVMGKGIVCTPVITPLEKQMYEVKDGVQGHSGDI